MKRLCIQKISRVLGAAVVCLLAAGCSPQTDAEREYLERRRVESLVRESIRETLEGGAEESEAVDLVKQSRAADGSGTTESWLREAMDERKGDILFPRWQAFRRGLDRYEVWFSYTFMAPAGGVEKVGYSWNVDLMLKTVNEPRPLTERELGMRTSRYFQSREMESRNIQLLQD